MLSLLSLLLFSLSCCLSLFFPLVYLKYSIPHTIIWTLLLPICINYTENHVDNLLFKSYFVAFLQLQIILLWICTLSILLLAYTGNLVFKMSCCVKFQVHAKVERIVEWTPRVPITQLQDLSHRTIVFYL